MKYFFVLLFCMAINYGMAVEPIVVSKYSIIDALEKIIKNNDMRIQQTKIKDYLGIFHLDDLHQKRLFDYIEYWVNNFQGYAIFTQEKKYLSQKAFEDGFLKTWEHIFTDYTDSIVDDFFDNNRINEIGNFLPHVSQETLLKEFLVIMRLIAYFIELQMKSVLASIQRQ